jgi:pilus assembly protein CpaD
MSAYQVHGQRGARSWFRATARFARVVGVPVVLATGLTGCLNYTHSGDHYVPEAHTERYPIKVTRAMARLDVDVDGAKRLTGDDRARVAQFARDYGTRSGGPMIVARPEGGPNHVAAATKVASIQHELREAGVPPGAISYRVYQAGASDRAAPVILTYETFEAISPECGNWQQNTANTYTNRPYPNFGCASQRNLAAMVANPRDLVEPRAMTPADAGRRGVVLEAWRKGEKTQSERGPDDSGQVSEQKSGE